MLASNVTKPIEIIRENPVNKKGVGYYFDNVKVEEILPE